MQRILVIGCGLIGTSIALALVGSDSEFEVFGVDPLPDNRETAEHMGAFQKTYDVDEIPPVQFDIVILATPVRIACKWLTKALALASVVMDVCSVKKSICEVARDLGATNRFVPTHPMAGRAIGGPTGATADLFVGKPWLYIQGWSAVDKVLPLIQATGAILMPVSTEFEHDDAMAAVSHGIHITSLSAMLAYRKSTLQADHPFHGMTGPAFKDITRLASSPSEFWTETLLENRISVSAQIERVIETLNEFKQVLVNHDEERLRALLDEARRAHSLWREENSRVIHVDSK